MGKTLSEKIWADHVVRSAAGEPDLLYIDLHLIHEVTSPQAFDGLRLAGRKVRRPDLTIATEDHNTPTLNIDKPIADSVSKLQIDTLRNNAKEFGIRIHSLGDIDQGIVHVVGPQLGITQPGMTIVCGDSHTSTHGAFGALAFGVGTSDVEHVLATQCLAIRPMKRMLVRVQGQLAGGVSAKDLVLHIIGVLGTAGATGYAIEFGGAAIRGLSMEGRMTLCNMAIEAGARVGLVGVDQKTIDYLQGRPHAPQGVLWEAAVQSWRTLVSDEGAAFDRVLEVDAGVLQPMVTWGTSPEMVVGIDGRVPDPADEQDPVRRAGMQAALAYMGLEAGTPMREIAIDKVFIGSCTNARIEDLRTAAAVVKGRRVAANIVQALVVPGSGLVKLQAEAEGLDKVFTEAGLEWREPGCSMCLGMNDDRLSPGERCASTSNRNFEGRQGPGGRSHLLSPALAAAAAIAGRLARVEDLQPVELEAA